jgi:hypothetical protein
MQNRSKRATATRVAGIYYFVRRRSGVTKVFKTKTAKAEDALRKELHWTLKIANLSLPFHHPGFLAEWARKVGAR